MAPPTLSEWACLGVLYPSPAHGFAVAARLAPSADVGRVWSVSRPLTYRSLDQLSARGYIAATGHEPGIAGGNRTILSATRLGRARFRTWMADATPHLRDLRSELLLKLVLGPLCGIDLAPMLRDQQVRVTQIAAGLQRDIEVGGAVDLVTLWRLESSRAALRFLDQVGSGSASSRIPTASRFRS